MEIAVRTLQHALSNYGHAVAVDGIIGPQTLTAMRQVVQEEVGNVVMSWRPERVSMAMQQIFLRDGGFNPGPIDGYFGPQTEYAVERWQNSMRDVPQEESLIAHIKPVWPRERDVARIFGPIGKHHKRLKSPYPLRLAWNLSETIDSFIIHEKVHDSALRVMERQLKHYGLGQIQALRLNRFGGCFNPRRKRGGNSWSMHAYAIAIDWDTEFNKFRWGRNRASLAQKEYDAWWNIWEEDGWVSLGRELNYDWQHVQAARL